MALPELANICGLNASQVTTVGKGLIMILDWCNPASQIGLTFVGKLGAGMILTRFQEEKGGVVKRGGAAVPCIELEAHTTQQWIVYVQGGWARMLPPTLKKVLSYFISLSQSLHVFS